MIKINLLPQKKTKRGRGVAAAGPGKGEGGRTQALIGVGALAAAGVAVGFLIHLPMVRERKELEKTTERVAAENTIKQKNLKDFEELKKQVEAVGERSASIEKLVKAKAVPANLLHELGEILTPGHQLTMSAEMTKKLGDGPEGDPNKRYQLDWDPKHVWITSFVEKDGAFTLKGGAQADPDVTQLAKRMQASVYFRDVAPRGGVQMVDSDTNVPYYEFTITGKVVY